MLHGLKRPQQCKACVAAHIYTKCFDLLPSAGLDTDLHLDICVREVVLRRVLPIIIDEVVEN